MKKYYITTFLSDSIIHSRIEVSKAEFHKQFDEVMQQYKEKDSEFEVDMSTYMNSDDTQISKTVEFSYSICSVAFTITTCKEGYCFRK